MLWCHGHHDELDQVKGSYFNSMCFFRPIAGYANLCPAMISSQPQEFEGMLSTVKHEIIHALVQICVSPAAFRFTQRLQMMYVVTMLFLLSSRGFQLACLLSTMTMRVNL